MNITDNEQLNYDFKIRESAKLDDIIKFRFDFIMLPVSSVESLLSGIDTDLIDIISITIVQKFSIVRDERPLKKGTLGYNKNFQELFRKFDF